MISKTRRPVAKVVSKPVAVAKSAAPAKKPAVHASRFDAKVSARAEQRSPLARRQAIADAWQLRGALRSKDKDAAFDAAKRIAERLNVPLSKGATTAKRVLTEVGRQVIGPDFKFTRALDGYIAVKCAYSSRNPFIQKPNDPDPTSRVRWT